MEDIFLDDPRQSSAQNLARSQKEKKAPRRRLREYLVDLIIKSLLLATLFGLDFTLFAEAGSYNLFTPEQTLTAEAGWIYGAIVVFSFAVLFLFSFSLTLQNFIISLGAALMLLAVFNQFALFDQSSLLAAYFNTVRNTASTDIFSNYSHLVIAAALLLVMFVFLTFARRSTQTYLLGTLLLILGGLLSDAYFNPVSRIFDTKSALNDESSHSNGRNFIFIALPDSPSYNKLRDMNEDGKHNDLKQAADNVLGFYQTNNFTYYPYAYVRHARQPFMNLVDSLNPGNTKKPEELLLSDVILNSYWNFKNLDNHKLYLRENRVFNTFHKNDYNLRIYQGRGIELCDINSRLAVNRCIEKVNQPISFSDLNFSSPQKTALLSAQWLESTGLIPGINPLLGIASAFNSEITPLRFSTSQLNLINAFKTLDLIADDIAADHGNNAYFTVLDLPGDLFIYDNLCNLKPVSRWVSATDTGTGLSVRKSAFAEQTSCLYGQLENFMQKLQKSGKLEHTVIVIQGLSAPFPATPGLEKDLFIALQASRQTGMAIYDPLKNQADINYQLCTAPAILRSYLYKKPCTELEDFTITKQLRTEIMEKAAKQKLTNKQTEKARESFKKWYESWAAHNQVENKLSAEVIPLEKTPETAEIVPEKEIKTVPVAETEELAPETKAQTLGEAAAEEEKKEEEKAAPQSEAQIPATAEEKPAAKEESGTKEDSTAKEEPEAEEKPLPKPEQLKKEFKDKQASPKTENTTIKKDGKSKVSVEVKVIDKTASNDVVPPFLLGELQYKAAETETRE